LFKNKVFQRALLFLFGLIMTVGNLLPTATAVAQQNSIYLKGTQYEGQPTVFVSQRNLEWYINNGYDEITTSRIVAPTQNQTYRIQPGEYQFDYDTLPMARDDNRDYQCDLNAEGFCMIEKYSWTDTSMTKKIPEQLKPLTPWGNLTHTTWGSMSFKPINDNTPVRQGDFLSAFHSEISVCSTSKQDAYLQKNNTIDYFGENPDVATFPGCAPPPDTITPRYASHGCIRAPRYRLWSLYTFVILNKEAGIKVRIVFLD